jgi:NitT/TauT family transport system substrate-binding protein
VGIDDVSLIIFDDSLTAIIGKGVNLTAADTDAIIEAHVQKGVDVWCLGTRRDKEDLIFGLAPGVTLESLKGSKKSVSGGLVGSRNEVIGKGMLAELGLDPENDVEWITLGGGSDTRLAALLNGNLAGSNLQVRHIKTLEDAGGTIVYNKRRTIPQEFYVAMGDFIEKNPDTVQAFMTTIVRAKQFVKDLNNKDEVISIMEKNGFEFSQEFKDAYGDGVDVLSADAGFEIPEMEELWGEVAATGEVPADFPWRDGLKLDFLWKAQELNGLPRRPASL